MDTTDEQYAKFGAYVAGVMDGYYTSEERNSSLVVLAIEMGAARLGVEFKRA